MSVTAISYLHENGSSGTIELQSSQPWGVTSMTGSIRYIDEYTDNENLLYNFDQTIAITIVDDFNAVAVIGTVPPGEFSFRVPSIAFDKNFNLREGLFTYAIETVANNNVNTVIRGYALNNTGPGIVLFMPNTFVTQLSETEQRGVLMQGEEIKAYVIGKMFTGVWKTTLPRRPWPYNGIVYKGFIWVGQPPTDFQTYDFIADVKTRGKKVGAVRSSITMKSGEFIQTSSPVFDIQPDHRFTISGGY